MVKNIIPIEIEVIVSSKEVVITQEGVIDLVDLFDSIWNWLASPVGMAYDDIVDFVPEFELPNTKKTKSILIFKDGWKIAAAGGVSIIGGFITGRDKSKKYYNPISDESVGQITLENEESDWKPSTKQINGVKLLAENFKVDWEYSTQTNEIKRKENASKKNYTLLGLYWFLKYEWVGNKSNSKFKFPIKRDTKIPRKGVVREYELDSNWNIRTEDLKYLAEGILIQDGNELVSKKEDDNIIQVGQSQIDFRDKNNVEAVLGVEDLAFELSRIIEGMKYEQGRMIGVFGKWGRGKSFLLNETWKYLSATKISKRRFWFLNIEKFVNLKVELHAWKYKDTPAIWAYLYELFAEAFYNDSNGFLFKRIWKRIVLNCYRIGILPIVFFFSGLSISLIIAFAFSLEDKIFHISNIIESIGVSIVVSLIIIYFRHENTARELFKKYFSNISFENALGIQAEVQKELKYLLKAIKFFNKNKKIILFVEDIDRCPESMIIQVIDSLRVMLEDKEVSENIMVVAAIDASILKRAIKTKYYHSLSLGKSDNDLKEIEKELNTLTKEYMDKLFILGIKLGKLNSQEIDEFFMQLTKHDRDISYESSTEALSGSADGKAYVTGTLTPATDKKPNSVEDVNYSIDENSVKKSSSLSNEEMTLLRNCLSKTDELTPRQVRIFYFRYLLARNLLIKTYQNNNYTNIWMSINNCELFIKCLLNYSTTNQDLHKHLNIVMNLETETTEVHLFPEENVPTRDYYELLKVLDIVIAY